MDAHSRVETERYLMDCHGMFYELSPVAYDGKIWGLRPISTHLRVIPDFCSWNGFLVLASNQVTPIGDANLWAASHRAGCGWAKQTICGVSVSPPVGVAHGGKIVCWQVNRRIPT